MCYLYFFCLHCLINIHIFDYPDSRLSGLFTLVPPSPDNRGSTVLVYLWAQIFYQTGVHLTIYNYLPENTRSDTSLYARRTSLII